MVIKLRKKQHKEISELTSYISKMRDAGISNNKMAKKIKEKFNIDYRNVRIKIDEYGGYIVR